MTNGCQNMLSEPTRKLSQFIVLTQFEDIPKEVIEKTKEVILDTIGCAFGGYQTDLGALCIKYIRSLGGNQQCTVIGSGEKTSCTNAAYANSRMANALDADETSSLPSHHANATLGAALACCELAGGAGKDLITSTAIGYDVGTRVELSINRHSERPCLMISPIFGAVAAAAKALSLDENTTAHAMGLAGAHIPVSTSAKFSEYEHIPLYKYGDAGWASMTGVSAALLAKLGMTGYDTILDGEEGLWRMCGASKYDLNIVERLGKEWHIQETAFKPWPSCRFTHTPITAFKKIIQENNLKIEQIDNVTIRVGTLRWGANRRAFSNQNPVDMMDAQFCHPHAIAMIALNIRQGPEWQSPEILNDPKVRAFRKKVSVIHDPSIKVVSEEGKRRRRPTTVEVIAEGKKYTATLDRARGDPSSEETKMNHQEIVEKFRLLASGVAVSSQTWVSRIEEIIRLLESLETIGRIDDLIAKLSAS